MKTVSVKGWCESNSAEISCNIKKLNVQIVRSVLSKLSL